MIFDELKRVPLGDVATTIVKEGGAVVGGLGVAGVAGRQVENMFMGLTPVTPTSSTTDKVKAALANNIPKAIIYKLLAGKGGMYEDVRKGVVTSGAFDILMRLTNSGVNPASATIMGYQVLGHDNAIANVGGADPATVNRLVQENAGLRAELSKLKGSQIQVQQVPYAQGPMDPRLPPYVGSGAVPPADRERKFAFMQPNIPGVTRPPGTAARGQKFGFAGETAIMSTGGKPGAAYVQAGKMFGMQ
jgi:hypothetical protein